MNPNAWLEILAQDARDADRLDEDGYERMVNDLNALSRPDLAQAVIHFGDLDTDVVTSYRRSSRRQMAREVIESLFLTLCYLKDERLIELIRENLDETVRHDLKSVVLRGLRRCKFVPSGDLTYRDTFRLLLSVIVLDDVLEELGVADEG